MKALVRDFSGDPEIIRRVTLQLTRRAIQSIVYDDPSVLEYKLYIDNLSEIDIAIIILDGVLFSSENESDALSTIAKNSIIEVGLLDGRLSINNVCILIANSDVYLPTCFSAYTQISLGSGIAIKRFDVWLRKIKTREVSSPQKMTSNFVSLETALSSIVDTKKEFSNVRVFALSTIKSADILMKSGIQMKKATLLIREFTIVDEFLQLSMESSINKSIELWIKMRASGIIDELKMLRFDFHPTTGMYIFDNQFVVLGNVYFDIKKGEYSFDNREVLFIDSSSDFGKQFIHKCIAHFDKLAEIYNE